MATQGTAVDAQYAKIRSDAWFNSMRTAVIGIVTGLANAKAKLRQQGEIELQVDTVPVVMSYSDDDVFLKIGDGGSGQPLYDMRIPKVWID